MDSARPPRALLVYPRFSPNSFWNYHETCELVGARYPAAPLGLLTVAALLPPSWELRLVDRNVEELSDADLAWADLVLTGGMLPQQRDALAIVARAQAAGRPVAVGGPDVSSSPEAYDAAEFVVVGEGEELVPELARDFAAGARRGRYRAARFADVTRSPVPRFDLLRFDRYLHVGVQYSRGCPFNCEFCDIIELYGRVPRVKAPEQMLRELDALRALGYRGHVDFVDDNLIGNKKAVKLFLAELRPWLERHNWPFEFTTEATINLADDRELLRLMQETGFFAIFVGIESPDEETLVQTQKKQNTRRELSRSVEAIYRAGMFVNAGFIAGFDSERGSIAPGMIDCIEATSIPVCMVGLLYALPNTQLTRRLQAEGRLHPGNGVLASEDHTDQCTTGLNFETARPRAAVLRDYRAVLDHAYAPANYFRRVRGVARHLDASFHRHRPSLPRLLRELRALGRILLRMGVADRAVRRELWRTLGDAARHNPRALPRVVALAALYRHMGPFARYVSERLGRHIAEVESGAWVAPEPVRPLAPAARPA